jgi:hypothetical protein
MTLAGSIAASVVLACSLVSGCGGYQGSEGPIILDPSTPQVRCNDLDELQVGEFFVQNNRWGKGTVTDFEQCISKEGEHGFPVRWHWDWPEGDANQVKAYPFIGSGQDPWRTASTTPALPRRVGELAVLSVDYSLTLAAEGRYNLAFDIWITSEPGVTTPPEANITREMMIWLDSTAGAQLAPLVEEVTIEGEAYSFHAALGATDAGYTRDYLAFVKVEPEHTGSTNIVAFVSYLVANGYLTADEYLRNVFLGNEVWFGTGELTLDGLVVTVE